MVNINPENNIVSIKVSTIGNKANTNICSDLTKYYSDLSKDWAVKIDGLVEHTDNSSKYYAQESKKQANIAVEKTEEIINNATKAINNIDAAKTYALEEVINQETLSKNNVVDEANAQITDIKENGAIQIKLATEQAYLAKQYADSIGFDMEKVNTSKMYLSGNVSEDTQGFEQLKQMKRSTFDLSKFTVVGSPTITNDGVVSGFGQNKHLISNYTPIINSNSNIIIKFNNVLPSSIPSNHWFLSTGKAFTDSNLQLLRNVNTSKIELYLGTVNISSDLALALNKSYDFEIEFKSGKCNVRVKTSEDSIYTTYISNYQIPSGFNSNGALIIGAIAGNALFYNYGSIDLKKFSITVDGVEVFNGNKTGLGVIKPDNYEVVGSPVISEDGVARGFSNSSYLNITSALSSLTTAYQFNFEFTTGSAISNNQNVFGFIKDNAQNMVRVLIYRSRLTFNVVVNNTATILQAPNDLSVNTDYVAEAGQLANGNLFLRYKQKDSANWTEVTPISGTLPNLTSITTARIGQAPHNTAEPFLGSIDLNSFKNYVDGNLVYQPCLKIPYTQSKTGSKIVDVAYRDRVIDLYEQEGQAGYYTIDEENKNFTLPMGEIYGMIGQRSLISSTVTETNRVDIYSDKTCLICGNVATAGTINLPIELVNNNYFITLSTSTKTATSFTTTATGDYILIGKVI